MTKWKIGLVILGLMSVIGCGDSGSDDGEDGASNGASNGTANDATNGGANTNTGANATEEDASATGGDNTAGATGGATAGPTAGGADAGSTTGTPVAGACTNAADKAIIDAAKVEKLACEGGACAGKHILQGAAAQTKCIAEEAPTLKQLSAGCQKCFDTITTCVPNECVDLAIGGFMGTGECAPSAPNSDFSKCPSTTAADPKCQACQMRECAPAFTTCSGLSM